MRAQRVVCTTVLDQVVGVWVKRSGVWKLNAKNKYGLSEGELGTDSDELCLEPIREEEPCQIS